MIRVFPASLAVRSNRLRRSNRGWSLLTYALVVAITAPVVTLIVIALAAEDAVSLWSHLASTRLPVYTRNTVVLVFSVCLVTLVLGTLTAWLVVHCSFPGSRVFSWLLFLPIVIPSYVLAMVIIDILDTGGPVWSLLARWIGDEAAQAIPSPRSLPMAILSLSLALYPYVYIFVRAAFLTQSAAPLEAARLLAARPLARILRIGLPLARPAATAGLMLVAMETLADFGTVQLFAVPTLSAGVYRVWVGMDEIAGAAQIACVLAAFALALWVGGAAGASGSALW